MSSPFILTLDAGGTNLVFGAMSATGFVGSKVTLPSHGSDLKACLESMVQGFNQVLESLADTPAAISFAFPGPADYPRGIIGGFLPNFPAFRDGVPLKDFLQEQFHLPVFINNDGDLFAYGEAIAGRLPELNQALEEAGSPRRLRNLLGFTFGTGFGVGQVMDGKLNRGNNSCTEVFCLPSLYDADIMVEDDVSIRAIVREYELLGGEKGLTPLEIARKARQGDESAQKSYQRFGCAAGDVMATAATLTDSVIVIGGGITGSRDLYMASLLERMRSNINMHTGETLSRMPMKVFNLDDPAELSEFVQGDCHMISVPGSATKVAYDPEKRTGVCTSALGASEAICTGAYHFALSQI